MCGIFGTTFPVSAAQLAASKAALQHRGPDSNGEETVTLGSGKEIVLQHTRLAIQDLSPSGHQPMWSQCGRWLVTFNGEIYNHYDIRKQLSVSFRSSSDTETLVEAISHFGVEKTLPLLNGIFAFAALDTHSETLYVARDPFGIKPVYYVQESGGLSFSSEVKPLLAVHGKRKLNPSGLSLFLNLRYTPSPDTLLEGVERLAAGHLLTYQCQSDQLNLSCYSQANQDRFDGSLDEAVDQYHQVLGEAVQRQLIGDVPVGILLSGGIDSALVAFHAKAHPGITGYTVGFGDDYDDCEIADAAETASTLGIAHQHVTIDPTRFIHELPTIVRSVEEPLGTTSIMAMWSLTQLAKRDVTVALTGQGSDEPWGGYRRYKIEHLMARLPFLKNGVSKPLSWLAGLSNKEAIVRGLGCVGSSNTAERFHRAYALFSENDARALFPALENNTQAAIQRWLDWLPLGLAMPSAEQMMRIDTRLNLADDLLLYGDKISMAFALEARVPMLDIDLVKFIESLPLHYRSSFQQTKIVHKLSAQRYLPTHIVNRKKKGFQVPFGAWSKSLWRESVEAHLLAEDNPLFQQVERKALLSIWQRHLKGGRDLSKQIFALLTLSIWAKEFL